MKNNIKILIISIVFSFTFIQNSSAATFGPATEYEVEIREVALCETGSTISNCLNPVVISSSVRSMDIAAVASGESAGSIGSLSKATLGVKYTFIQVLMKRSMQVTGTDSLCNTAASGTLTDFAVGHGSNAAASVVLFVPPSSDVTHTGGHMNGYDLSDGSVSAANTIADDDDYIHFRKIISGGLTLTSGVIPSLKIEFDVSRAVQGNSSTCTNAVMNAAEPVMTISFQ